MKPTARILSALLAAAMLLPSQALAAETAPEAAAAAVTAEAPQSEFVVTFAAEHAGVDVYYTHDYTKADEENVSAAFAQNSDTGEIDTTGDGQVNFRLRPEEGYEIVSVMADQNYKNLKGADDTGVEGIYRLTKVKAAGSSRRSLSIPRSSPGRSGCRASATTPPPCGLSWPGVTTPAP